MLPGSWRRSQELLKEDVIENSCWHHFRLRNSSNENGSVSRLPTVERVPGRERVYMSTFQYTIFSSVSEGVDRRSALGVVVLPGVGGDARGGVLRPRSFSGVRCGR